MCNGREGSSERTLPEVGHAKFAVVYRVQDAKRAETRARRIQQYVEMLARGGTPHPQRRSPG